MSACSSCKKSASTVNPFIVCSGICQKQFHISCVKITSDVLKIIQSTSGLFWQCSSCTQNSIFNVVTNELDKRFDDFLSNLNKQFDNLKTDIVSKIPSMTEIASMVKSDPASPSNFDNNSIPKPLYSNKLIGQPKSQIIVTPKNEEQAAAITEMDMLTNADLLNSDIKFSKVKNIGHGRLIIECDSNNKSSELKNLVNTKLSDKYNVREVSFPRLSIRIVGFSDYFTTENISTYLKKQNDSLFMSNSHCELKKLWNVKNKDQVFQAIFEVDRETYNSLLNAGEVIVGTRTCSVYDSISVTRCFRCNGFFHTSKNCRKVHNCPLCAGAHELKNCPNKGENCDLKCNNCTLLMSKRTDTKISNAHAAWDYSKCHSYHEAVNKIKADLFEIGSS